MNATKINPALMAEVERLEVKLAENKYLCEVKSNGFKTSIKFIKADVMSAPLENTSVDNNKTLAVATHQAIMITYDPMDGDISKLDRVNNKPTVVEIYPTLTRYVSKELFDTIYSSSNLEDSYEYLKLVLGL